MPIELSKVRTATPQNDSKTLPKIKESGILDSIVCVKFSDPMKAVK